MDDLKERIIKSYQEKKLLRRKKMNNNRVELCCHTKMSKLLGVNSAKEYIEEAIARGYKAIAITDTNSTQAFFEAN